MGLYLLAGVAVGIPLLALIALEPFFGVILLAVSIPLLSWLNEPSISPSLVLGALSAVAWLFNALVTRRRIHVPTPFVAMLAYAAVAWVSLMVNQGINLDTIHRALTYASFLLLVLMVYGLTDTEQRLRTLLTATSISISGTVSFGLFLFFFAHSLYTRMHPACLACPSGPAYRDPLFAGGGFRLEIGLAGHTEADSLAKLMVGLLPMHAALYSRSGATGRLLIIATIVLWIGSVTMIASRGALVGAAVVGGVYLLLVGGQQLRRAPSLAGAGVLSLLLVGVPLLNAHFIERFHLGWTSRQLIWHSAWNLFKQHAFLGVGPGYFGEFFIRNLNGAMVNQLLIIGAFTPKEVTARAAGMAAHNFVLNVLAETGVLGLFSFLYFLVVVFWTGSRLIKRRQAAGQPGTFESGLLIQLLAGLAGYVASSIFVALERDRVFYLMIGLTLAAARLCEEADQSPVSRAA